MLNQPRQNSHLSIVLFQEKKKGKKKAFSALQLSNKMSYAPILQRHATAPDRTLTRHADGSTSCVKDIFRAAVEGDVECIEANLSIGVDINALGQPADVWGPRYEKSGLFYATPLHYACSYGREAAVRTLLQHGARTDIRSASGLSCKEYARRRNYVSILMLLDSHERHD